jgi:hypothetical protein
MSGFREEKFSPSGHFTNKKRDMNRMASSLKNAAVRENVISLLSSYSVVDRESLIMNYIKLKQDLENVMDDAEAADILMNFINYSGINAIELVELVDDAEGKLYVQEIRSKFNAFFAGFYTNHPGDWAAVSTRPYYDIKESYVCLEIKLQKRSGDIVILDSPADRLASLLGFLVEQLKRTLNVIEIKERADVSSIFRHATEIRDSADQIIQKFRPAISYSRVERHKILNENDRRILGTRYFGSLCEKMSAAQGKRTRFTKREVFGEGILDAYNSDLVIPLIIEKLSSLGYIREHEKDEISLTHEGLRHCGEDIVLDESI